MAKSKEIIERMEARLLAERDRALESLRQAEEEESEGQRESGGALSRVPDHQADAGSDTQEAEKDWANVNRSTEQITRIDAALRLLREDPQTYLTCERCGRPIEEERLEVVPWTRFCASCARAVETGREAPPG